MIAETDGIEKQFGSRGHYLVDFYHVCEYSEDAAPSCCGKNGKKTWTARQKEFLKAGCTEKVIESPRDHLEPEEKEDRNAPVRRCLRYFINRPGQFDYSEARKRGPPAGSGEIGSAHR
ncbi:MAG: hypothetical protein D3906_09420 [Candidatus Electrothrix sp. AUS1_2]|nr:hypothetical protein [Candidatus Electrothrix sp. AUS1_2]